MLGDFGIAAPIGLSVEKDEFGGASPPWASPEQQLDRESLTPASDAYALAATIYTLLVGRSPHVDVSGADRNDQLSMLDRVLHRQHDLRASSCQRPAHRLRLAVRPSPARFRSPAPGR